MFVFIVNLFYVYYTINQSFRKMKESPSPLKLVLEANLSFRELEVLEQVKQGVTCKEISKNLCIGLETVKTHRKKIICKLGLKGKTEFSMFMLELLVQGNTNLNQLLHAKSPQTHPKITPRGD